jgi:hypothetical protein
MLPPPEPIPLNLLLGNLGIGGAISGFPNLISQVGQQVLPPDGGGGVAPPPTSGPPPPPPVSTSGHWQNPDWEALIRGDQQYIQGIGNIAAQEQTLNEQRQKAIKQALIQFGVIPAGYTSKYGDVNQTDIEAAKNNPFSTIATLADQYARGGQDLSARLAARGILSSGALTGGNQALTTAHDRAVNDATQQLLAALSGYEGNYASGYGALEGQKTGLYGEVGQRIAGQYQPTWIADPPVAAPPPVPAPPAPPVSQAPLPTPPTFGSSLVGLVGGRRPFNQRGLIGQLGLEF